MSAVGGIKAELATVRAQRVEAAAVLDSAYKAFDKARIGCPQWMAPKVVRRVSHEALTFFKVSLLPSCSTNPTRAHRVQSMVDNVVWAAMTDALDELQGEVERGDVTEAEIVEALSWYPYFADGWGRTS